MDVIARCLRQRRSLALSWLPALGSWAVRLNSWTNKINCKWFIALRLNFFQWACFRVLVLNLPLSSVFSLLQFLLFLLILLLKILLFCQWYRIKLCRWYRFLLLSSFFFYILNRASQFFFLVVFKFLLFLSFLNCCNFISYFSRICR